ncbi:unnamed protein product [Merluccius merluccius]
MANTAARNGSDFLFLGRFPGAAAAAAAMLYNNGTSCRNLTDGGNNATGTGGGAAGVAVDARCEQDRVASGNFDGGDATPVIIAIVITALYSIVCVVGLVGNVLVMYVIIR